VKYLLALSFFFYGVAAFAQSENCSHMTSILTNDHQVWSAGDTYITAETKVYKWTCYNSNTKNSSYDTGTVQLGPITGTTGIDPNNGEPLYCDPTWQTTGPVNPNPIEGTAFNTFTLQAWPGVFAQTSCQKGGREYDLGECQAVACVTNPGGSPIVVDVSGQGFFLTNAADGVWFDISGSGTPIKMGWTAGSAQNAFLALPGPDGLVHNGKELFGNFTPQPPSETPNGFAALAVYDDNHDGVIDARDAVWKSLRLWIDANHDGVSQPEELHTLAELGVNSISLHYKEEPWHDQFGNAFRYRARVGDETTDKWTYDVFFVSDCKGKP
jgi:hypothetical protein